MKSAIFWIFQHWIPVTAAAFAPLGLLLYNDEFGALDLIATGAISFIGVFLIFGVALEIIDIPEKKDRWLLFAVLLLGIGTVLILLSGVATAAYVLMVQLPSHRNPEAEANVGAQNVIYGSVSFALYIAGVLVALFARRFLRANGVISLAT